MWVDRIVSAAWKIPKLYILSNLLIHIFLKAIPPTTYVATIPQESDGYFKKKWSIFGRSIFPWIINPLYLNIGNNCPNHFYHSTKQVNVSPPKELLLRYKRENDEESETDEPVATISPPPSSSETDDTTDPLNQTLPRSIRYPISHLENDTFSTQHNKLRVFNIMRKRGFPELNRTPSTQRFILLEKSFKLFSKIVPHEMVPSDLTEAGFQSFFYLFEGYDVDVGRLTGTQFDRIVAVLTKCGEKVKPWNKSDVLEIRYQNGTCPKKVGAIIS